MDPRAGVTPSIRNFAHAIDRQRQALERIPVLDAQRADLEETARSLDEAEAAALAVEGEEAAVGDQRDRPARAVDVRRARPWRADEIDLRHQRPPRMLGAEQDHPRHNIVEIRRAEGPGKPRLWLLVGADADEIDVTLAVDLPPGEEERVDTALAGAIEQFAPAVGEPVPLQQRDVGAAAAVPLARQERRRCRDRRGVADRDVPHVADQPGDDVGQQLLVAEFPCGRGGGRNHRRPPLDSLSRLRERVASSASCEPGEGLLLVRPSPALAIARAPLSSGAGEG
jgi:hypothetical protein